MVGNSSMYDYVVYLFVAIDNIGKYCSLVAPLAGDIILG